MASPKQISCDQVHCKCIFSLLCCQKYNFFNLILKWIRLELKLMAVRCGDSEHGWLLSNGLPGRIKPPRSMPCFLNVFVIVFVFVPVIVFVFVCVCVCVCVCVYLISYTDLPSTKLVRSVTFAAFLRPKTLHIVTWVQSMSQAWQTWRKFHPDSFQFVPQNLSPVLRLCPAYGLFNRSMR